MRYKITIEYDGTDYVGWQKQSDLPHKLSIEEVIEKAVFQMTGERTKINGAGRTDAGVHAIAQVADFFVHKEFDALRIVAGLNNYLVKSSVSIVNCEIVDDNFSSRFDAKMRHYRYIIINRKANLALQKNRAWHVRSPLDAKAMQIAANYLIGEHDFSSFRDAECQAISPIRTMEKITIKTTEDSLVIDISAKSFLHHMVRNIVGTLMWVGKNKINSSDILQILKSCDRTKSGPNAPACGLYFLGVDY